jgi:parvulin-like peptidyl-prolyl isomerase
LTKKHLAKLEKEQRQNKILLFGIIAIVVVIIGLIGFGVLNNSVLKNKRTVATVGKTKITVEQFVHRVSYDRYQLINTFVQYASSYFASFFQDQLISVQDQLDNYVQFGSDTLDTMIGEAALVQKAQSMGITVTDAEVETEIQSNLAYFPNGTPTPTAVTPTITYFPTATLSELQKKLTEHTATPTVPPTETPVVTATIDLTAEANAQATSTALGTPAPTATETGTPSATVETPTEVPTENLTPTETATITPTATEYTEAGYKNLYSTIVANIQTQATFTEAELRNYVRTVLYERKIFAEVAKGVSAEQDMVWARHIVVATQEQADEISKTLKAGGDWNSLVAQYSTDTNTNTIDGDMGWISAGTYGTDFDKVAFALEVGAISDPVKTTAGYEIIQSLGHETRQLTADQLSAAQNAAYKKFIEDAKTELGFKKYDIWASVVPSTPEIPSQYRISATTGSTGQ